MSDFDKEAEREKLREKYERDKADREATQRMSDLLLKGATMTNTHCGVCGDPLFRMDGTTFCPTCHGSPDAVEGNVPEAGTGGGRPADQTGSAEGTEAPAGDAATSTPADANEAADSSGTQIDVSSPSASRQSESGPETDPETDSESEPEPAADRSRETGAAPSGPDSSAATSANSSDVTRSAPSPSSSRRSHPRSPPSGDLEDAHTSLTRALEYFAREAATTDDPRYARECLEAAREAAETLSALR